MRVGEVTEWAPFECDGASYEWQALATEATTRGSREAVIVIVIAVRRLGAATGPGKLFPMHTNPSAEHARETVRFFRTRGVAI